MMEMAASLAIILFFPYSIFISLASLFGADGHGKI
jgi:hypothetical protein